MLFQSDYGWRLALWFSVILNVNLALLNLLPVPVLDGGHIVMACIEGIIRRPIPFFILNYVQTGFALLVIGYMLYVSFFDVQDLGSGAKEKTYKIKFEPVESTVTVDQ
jgi:regulator of sigma E protease